MARNKFAGIFNQITASIVENAVDGQTIRELARKIGFAYSAVYKWVNVLEEYGVLSIEKKGNKNLIWVNKNFVYEQFLKLIEAIHSTEKERAFWKIVKHFSGIRFVKSTAAVIWTQGAYITGDFFDRIYYLEVREKSITSFCRLLQKYSIGYCFGEKIKKVRPLVCLKKEKDFKIVRKNGLPVMPLTELVKWCKSLELESILEKLNEIYKLGLKIKYAEIYRI